MNFRLTNDMLVRNVNSVQLSSQLFEQHIKPSLSILSFEMKKLSFSYWIEVIPNPLKRKDGLSPSATLPSNGQKLVWRLCCLVSRDFFQFRVLYIKCRQDKYKIM